MWRRASCQSQGTHKKSQSPGRTLLGFQRPQRPAKPVDKIRLQSMSPRRHDIFENCWNDWSSRNRLCIIKGLPSSSNSDFPNSHPKFGFADQMIVRNFFKTDCIFFNYSQKHGMAGRVCLENYYYTSSWSNAHWTCGYQNLNITWSTLRQLREGYCTTSFENFCLMQEAQCRRSMFLACYRLDE